MEGKKEKRERKNPTLILGKSMDTQKLINKT